MPDSSEPPGSGPSTSFDPNATSFDPRTWGAAPPAGAPASPSPPPAAAAAPADKAGAPPTAASRRGLLIGGGVAAAAVVAGGAAWLTLGRARPGGAAAGAADAGSPAASQAVAAVERRLMTIDGLGSLPEALQTQGFAAATAQAASKAAGDALPGASGELRLELATLKPAQGAKVESRLVSLLLKKPDGNGVSVTQNEGRFVGAPIKAATHAAVRLVQGQVDAESFYSSAVTAGLEDAVIPDFFQAFVYDFDFQREIEPGAVFEAAIGSTADESGNTVGGRKLLYAAMTTAKKSIQLYRFTAPDAGAGDPGWYDGSGRSIKRGLMRTPVEGARISSSFGWRVHPVLGFQKLHKGTDFAAPIGTPIYASGDGVVEWAAMKGPNGNLTILQHDNGWETYYLHQNAFAPGVAPGAKVRQGQNIGWVGTTGRSTGPHLHYELHINKEAVDAMAQPLDAGKPLTGASLAAFTKARDAIDKLRAGGG